MGAEEEAGESAKVSLTSDWGGGCEFDEKKVSGIAVISLGLSGLMTGLVRGLGNRGSVIVVSVLGWVAVLAACVTAWDVVLGNMETQLDMGVWFESGGMALHWGIGMDGYGALMIVTVTVVSWAVFCFAGVYMRGDAHVSQFLSYLSLFSFFMGVMVSAMNVGVLFVGFEGTGVMSYLLISFWGQRQAAAKSAQKAIVVNRVSDGLLLWTIVMLYGYTGTMEWDLMVMNDMSGLSSVVGLALMMGCAGKSAQMLWHVWLPDSMEGPTPVSALLHAATLVTAGIFVLVRLPFVDPSAALLLGSVTALAAGIWGLFQNDLKRVIAFSTCSQLGYMVSAVGLGEHGAEAAMSHLLTHASFKAGMFLAAGALMMGMMSNQNLSRYGSMHGLHGSGMTVMGLGVCGVTLMGWPETSGFVTKEGIINLSGVSQNGLGDWVHTVLVLAAWVTCVYTAKVFMVCFVTDYSGLSPTQNGVGKPVHPLLTVAFAGIVGDIVCKIWMGVSLLSGVLFYVPWVVKTLPLGVLVGGVLTAMTQVTMENASLMRLHATRWGFDQMNARLVGCTIGDLGRVTWLGGDKGLFLV